MRGFLTNNVIVTDTGVKRLSDLAIEVFERCQSIQQAVIKYGGYNFTVRKSILREGLCFYVLASKHNKPFFSGIVDYAISVDGLIKDCNELCLL